jgi:ankyrin repeat protein
LALSRNSSDESIALIPRISDLNAGDSAHGSPPLYYAASSYRSALPIVEALIARGAKVDRRGIGGFTPLHGACTTPNRDVVEYLVAHGADVSARDEKGLTPLHVAASSLASTDEVIVFLLSHGADPEATDASGKKPADYAREYGCESRVALLKRRTTEK